MHTHSADQPCTCFIRSHRICVPTFSRHASHISYYKISHAHLDLAFTHLQVVEEIEALLVWHLRQQWSNGGRLCWKPTNLGPVLLFSHKAMIALAVFDRRQTIFWQCCDETRLCWKPTNTGPVILFSHKVTIALVVLTGTKHCFDSVAMKLCRNCPPPPCGGADNS